MSGDAWIALGIAAALALVHISVAALRFLEGIPRSRWLSAAGGAAVAYVFLHLLPDIAAAHEQAGVSSERLYFLLALVGLVVFYGIERHVRGAAGASAPGAFWLHVGSFAIYNLLVGYLLLHREVPGLGALLLYGGAMALHFLSSDFGMLLDHREAYQRRARWVLAASVGAGWALGVAIELHRPVVDALFALLGGGVVLNVMKEELPEERQSRFGAFLVGVVAYGALLWLV